MLQNKVILITGSTNGIGTATARHCVAQGAKVIIHGRTEDRAKALVAELGQDSAHYVLADLADENSYRYLVAETVKKFGTLDGLVNNAGIYPRNNIDTASLVLCEQIMRINFYAPLLLCQEAVKIFRKKGNGGSIVNIGSMNAYCGQPDLLIYSASKGALMTMTRNLADSLGPDRIRVNQLNVGWTPTDNEIALKKKEGLPDDWQHRVPKIYAPSGQLLSPDSVAAHVIFWLSDHSSPVTAAVYELEQYPIIGRNRLNDLVIS
jgi:NAD(P)-dependent dehydrogenase (short-subunit alcohol dehydrogenase family)